MKPAKPSTVWKKWSRRDRDADECKGRGDRVAVWCHASLFTARLPIESPTLSDMSEEKQALFDNQHCSEHANV